MIFKHIDMSKLSKLSYLVLLFVIMVVSDSCGGNTKELNKNIKNDRNKFKDPDFDEDFHHIVTIDDINFRYSNDTIENAELIIAVDLDYVYIMIFSPRSGYVMFYIKDDDEFDDVSQALNACDRWERRYPRDLQEIFFESRDDDIYQPNGYSISGFRNKRNSKGECLITMHDYRDEFLDHTYKIYLNPDQTRNLKYDLKEAKRTLDHDNPLDD